MDLLVNDLAAYIGGSGMMGNEEEEVERKREEEEGKREKGEGGTAKPKPSGFRAEKKGNLSPKKKLAWAETPGTPPPPFFFAYPISLVKIKGAASRPRNIRFFFHVFSLLSSLSPFLTSPPIQMTFYIRTQIR